MDPEVITQLASLKKSKGSFITHIIISFVSKTNNNILKYQFFIEPKY
jgi:hypothetical protein